MVENHWEKREGAASLNTFLLINVEYQTVFLGIASSSMLGRRTSKTLREVNTRL